MTDLTSTCWRLLSEKTEGIKFTESRVIAATFTVLFLTQRTASLTRLQAFSDPHGLVQFNETLVGFPPRDGSAIVLGPNPREPLEEVVWTGSDLQLTDFIASCNPMQTSEITTVASRRMNRGLRKTGPEEAPIGPNIKKTTYSDPNLQPCRGSDGGRSPTNQMAPELVCDTSCEKSLRLFCSDRISPTNQPETNQSLNRTERSEKTSAARWCLACSPCC